MPKKAKAEMRRVVVRLTADQFERFRQWAETHGSRRLADWMASVCENEIAETQRRLAERVMSTAMRPPTMEPQDVRCSGPDCDDRVAYCCVCPSATFVRWVCRAHLSWLTEQHWHAVPTYRAMAEDMI